MTFFLVGGMVLVAASLVCIIVYLIAHKMDENSVASKILIWTGVVMLVAGSSLLVIEFMFPQISHPAQPEPEYIPTVYDHFVSYYCDGYKTFIGSDNVVRVTHTQLNTITTEENSITYFLTDVVYINENNFFEKKIVNEYTYNTDYTYQNITSKFLN